MNWTKKQISILIIISITSFMGSFLISSINIALPAIEESFNMSALSLSWVVTAFLLSSAIFLLPAGKVGDLVGAERVYKVGLLIFTLSSLITPLAPTGIWVIIARFAQGVGAALTGTTGQAILVAAFPPKERGQVIGISVSSVYLGLSFGPFVGGIFTQHFGWHSIFYASALLGVISYVVALCYLERGRVLTESQKLSFKHFDKEGLLIFIAALFAIVYGSSRIPSLLGWSLMGGGVVMIILFWQIEKRAASTILEVKLFTQNRLFSFSNLAALINYSVTYTIVFLLSLFLQKSQQLTPQEAGLILIAQPIMMTLFSPFVGRLSDRFQPRYFASAGMAMCGIGLLMLSTLGADTQKWVIVLMLLWMGLGFALFSSPNMNVIMSSVDRTRYGIASGTAASMRVIGQITSMTIVTLLFAIFFDGSAIKEVSNELFIKVMRIGFVIFALLSTIGIYLSIVRGNLKREEEL